MTAPTTGCPHVAQAPPRRPGAHSIVLAAFALAALAPRGAHGAAADSRYAPLMATEAGIDTLRQIAFLEDQRITGEGRLAAWLRRGSPLVRRRAAEALGRIQDPIDAPALRRALDDPDPRVVREAVFALGQVRDTLATGALAAWARGRDPHAARLALEALGRIGTDAAVDAVVEHLHHFDAGMRREAARALGLARNARAVAALRIALHDPDSGVLAAAAWALERIGERDAAPALRPLLGHPDAAVRARAARALGRLGDRGADRDLEALLRDDDVHVVVQAAVALGRIGARRAVDGLARVLAHHASHQARMAAAEALGRLEHGRAREALIQALMDPSAAVRATAIVALARRAGRGVEPFARSLLDDGNRYVRAAAIRAFGVGDVRERLEWLVRGPLVDPSPLRREAAVAAIAALRDERGARALVDRLARERDFAVAATLVDSLAAWPGLDATLRARAESLMVAGFPERSARTDVAVRLAMLRAFARWRTPAAAPLARESLTHADWRIRRAARAWFVATGHSPPEVPDDRAIRRAYVDASRRRVLAPPSGTRHVVVSTRRGEFEIELFGDDAPQTVHQFVELARRGFYDGLAFNRVVADFVVQGGDPRGDLWGDAGYTIRSEFNPRRYERGTVGIAHDGKDTGGCQFFICLSPQPHLDGRYTAFGRVVRGMDVVDRLDLDDTMRIRVVD